jgi:hypothetical protein
MTDLKVGQTLWYVPNNYGRHPQQGRTVTVEKVGRKWAYIDHNERVDIKTMWVDGGQYSSPGKCYPSKEAYDNMVACQTEWSGLIDWMNRRDPTVSLDVLYEVKRILKVGAV